MISDIIKHPVLYSESSLAYPQVQFMMCGGLKVWTSNALKNVLELVLDSSNAICLDIVWSFPTVPYFMYGATTDI